MHIGVITLFPDLFAALNYGVLGRAIERGLIKTSYFNPHDFSQEKHRRVDDRPYGGGPGMVMMAEPLALCINQAKSALEAASVVYLSPQGQPFTQEIARKTAQQPTLLLLCGRYEGIDERIITHYVDEEWSIGDFVLSGGEFAALSIIDAVARLITGVLGHNDSAAEDSFSAGLLDYPHYTRPVEFNNSRVPDVLLSGDHAKIAEWRMQQSLIQTEKKRPDLLKKLQLTELQQKWLNAHIKLKDGSKKWPI